MQHASKENSTSSRSERTPGSTGGMDEKGETDNPVTVDCGTPSEIAGTSAGTGGVGTTRGTAGTSTGGATTMGIHVIKRIIYLCGFSEDSTMVKYIDQEQWTDLVLVSTLIIYDIKDFHKVRCDITYEASPLKTHCRILKCFLLFYKWRCSELSTTLDEDDVFCFTKTKFLDYCGSPGCYHDIKVAEGLAPATPNASEAGVRLFRNSNRRVVGFFG